MSEKQRFAFFLGCITPNRYPQLEKATKFVMEKLGVELLDMERATCCPAPGVFRSFDVLDWMVAGARNICIAEKMEADIITICNGCFGTLKDINVQLKKDEEARAKVNAKLKLLGDYEFKGSIRIRHAAEYLGEEVGPTEIQKHIVRKVNAKVAIHYGCHFLKPTGIRQIDSSESPSLLEDYVEALGLENVEFKEKLTCCGAGGGIKAAFADSSMTIFASKMKNIDAVKPDFIFDICPFCHLQYETGQDYLNKNFDTKYDYPVIHISQLTAFCMGMEMNFVGLQYQMMGQKYIFKGVKVEDNE